MDGLQRHATRWLAFAVLIAVVGVLSVLAGCDAAQPAAPATDCLAQPQRCA